MKSIGIKMPEKEAILLKKVANARGENVSDFIRRSIWTELAWLGFCTKEQEKALGLSIVEIKPKS